MQRTIQPSSSDPPVSLQAQGGSCASSCCQDHPSSPRYCRSRSMHQPQQPDSPSRYREAKSQLVTDDRSTSHKGYDRGTPGRFSSEQHSQGAEKPSGPACPGPLNLAADSRSQRQPSSKATAGIHTSRSRSRPTSQATTRDSQESQSHVEGRSSRKFLGALHDSVTSRVELAELRQQGRPSAPAKSPRRTHTQLPLMDTSYSSSVFRQHASAAAWRDVELEAQSQVKPEIRLRSRRIMEPAHSHSRGRHASEAAQPSASARHEPTASSSENATGLQAAGHGSRVSVLQEVQRINNRLRSTSHSGKHTGRSDRHAERSTRERQSFHPAMARSQGPDEGPPATASSSRSRNHGQKAGAGPQPSPEHRVKDRSATPRGSLQVLL